MGWGGGTEIFDQVADDIIDVSWNWTRESKHEDVVIPLLTKLYWVLSDKDWDNECESKYWDDPVIGKILGNTFEEE
jgi:hypothetical protein